ncbi:MAG: hypothetical protein ACFWTO_00410 [Hafnia paralvei]
MFKYFKIFIFFFIIFFLGNVFFKTNLSTNIIKSSLFSLVTLFAIFLFTSQWWKKNILKLKR